MAVGEGKNRRQTTVGKGAYKDGGCGLPRARSALAMTEAERTCVSFRDQSADWSWESVIPLCKSKGERIATASVRTGFAMTGFFQGVRWGLFSLSLLHFSRFCGILGVFNLVLKEFSPWKP